MKDLLKEAIADAKAVRETALANAKIALEEAFTPRLQSMLSAKLSEEEDMEAMADIEEEEDMEVAVEEPVAPEVEVEEPVAEGDYAEDEMSEEGDYAEDEMSEEDDLELEAILRELDDEEVSAEPGMDVSEEEELDMTESEDEEMTEEDDADVSLEEVIKALREEDGEEEQVEETEEEKVEVEADLEEAYQVIRFLKSKINEVNLLNAKLLFSNKLFRNYPLSESQKMKVIENFDRAKTLREVKLVFGTLAESFTVNKTRRKIVKESYASKATRSTAPKKILSEGNALAARWKKLANLK